jgi:hypothetical protein
MQDNQPLLKEHITMLKRIAAGLVTGIIIIVGLFCFLSINHAIQGNFAQIAKTLAQTK